MKSVACATDNPKGRNMKTDKVKFSAEFKATPKATVKLARSLRIGDILEAYYFDIENDKVVTHLELVIKGTPDNKTGDAWDITTIPLREFGERKTDTWGLKINTDRYRKVASLENIGHALKLQLEAKA